VVFMGLFCGLWLVPTEMMGDRVAAILVSMLIVVTSLQSDLGLGNLSYLIWVDTFNLTSLVMLSIALVETVIVHVMLRRNMEVAASFIDKVFRIVLPIGVYTCFVIGMVLEGLNPETGTGNLIIVLGSSTWIILGVLEVIRDFKHVMKNRREAVKELLALLSSLGSIDEDEEMEHSKQVNQLCDRVFMAYDYDRSGTVGNLELKDLMGKIFPDMDSTSKTTLTNKARKSLNLDEEMELGSFIKFIIFCWNVSCAAYGDGGGITGKRADMATALTRVDSKKLRPVLSKWQAGSDAQAPEETLPTTLPAYNGRAAGPSPSGEPARDQARFDIADEAHKDGPNHPPRSEELEKAETSPVEEAPRRRVRKSRPRMGSENAGPPHAVVSASDV